MIFTRDISFLRVACWIPAVMRPPIVYEAHKLYSFVDELSEADERTRVAIADGVVAISHGVATDLMKLDLSVTAIVPDAATLSQIPSESKAELRHSLGITDDTELLVYSGSLSTWRNDLELLIDVFTEIAEARPSIRLYIVGGGDDLPLLRKHATKVGAPMDRLTFTGHVPQKRVFEYLGAADTGIVPLTGHDRIATQYTSPLKLYEYLVSDLKVVASDVPAITSATEGVDSVFLYTPGDQTTFSRELREALDATEPSHDPDSFSYKERATRLETVFDSVISQD
jgi:glycosyltransferase involved in cell wall biosynthesis